MIALTLLFMAACSAPRTTVLVVTATPEPANLEATIAALAAKLAEGEGANVADPPTSTPAGADTSSPDEPPPPTASIPTPQPPAPTPTQQPRSDPPTAAVPFGVVSAPVSVNVRSGPDTAYPTIRVSARGSRLEVIGRSVDGEWWQVRVPDVAGGLGWVSTIYLETQNTAAVPVVPSPPLPTATVTNTPPPTNPPPPTATTPPTQPPPVANSLPFLDYGADPYYGSHTIHPTNDMQTVDISATGGGDLDVDDFPELPSHCTGYVSSAADVEVRWEGNGSSDLYIYFVAPSDTTLIINDPFGNWHCDDDSLGNGNPMISFSGASEGPYDIWIGRWGSAGLTSSGTLYIGEFHP
jgi:hypothetical protein